MASNWRLRHGRLIRKLMMTSAPPFAKHLASNDKKTRDKAVKSLATFLAMDERDPISKPDMDKLWKGIFYCFWMSDKPLVQQALAADLAELLLTTSSTTSALSFLSGFWEAIVREWNGIDRLRLDKYYMLVRRFINATFRLLAGADWAEDVCNTYNKMLTREGGPLCPNDQRVPSGLAYHLADIYLEELDKAVAATEPPPLPAPLSTLLSPFISLAAQTPTSITYKRIQSEVFSPLLEALAADDAPPAKKRRLDPDYAALLANACFDQPSTGKLDPTTLRQKLLRRIFDVASEPETRDSSRRKMYALFRQSTGEED
ncbi:rRNA processing protein [Mycena indigotica]|uniref:rRNA processing protein n=1 Tax=Mycena indigotica TaxID=2126181 RepID=A0A8H6SX79_9AGAR|nr:rRNA processing protein [Mycena indigotica]KAF7307086.1 rRNA processing protein [Mycena indigotica]